MLDVGEAPLPIRAVLFDYGATLVTGQVDIPEFRRKTRRYLRQRGLSITKRDLDRATDQVIGRLRRVRESNREMTFEEVYREILRLMGVRATREMIESIKDLYYSSYDWAPMEGAIDVLRELNRHYRLGIVSNVISKIPLRGLEEMGISDLFEVVVLSRDLGYIKPHPEPFRRALSEVGVTPEETVFVGNTVQTDIRGAKALGMKTILLLSEAQPGPSEADAETSKFADIPKMIREMNESSDWSRL